MLKQKQSLKKKTPLKAKTKLKPKSDKPTKQVKPTITKLRKKADKVFSLATRYRFAEYVDGEWVAECITCKVKKNIKQLQCGHFQSRRFNATRYSEENTATQCYSCNVMFSGEQFKFSQEVDSLYGEGTAKRLAKEARVSHPFSIEELLEVISDASNEVVFYETQHRDI